MNQITGILKVSSSQKNALVKHIKNFNKAVHYMYGELMYDKLIAKRNIPQIINNVQKYYLPDWLYAKQAIEKAKWLKDNYWGEEILQIISKVKKYYLPDWLYVKEAIAEWLENTPHHLTSPARGEGYNASVFFADAQNRKTTDSFISSPFQGEEKGEGKTSYLSPVSNSLIWSRRNLILYYVPKQKQFYLDVRLSWRNLPDCNLRFIPIKFAPFMKAYLKQFSIPVPNKPDIRLVRANSLSLYYKIPPSPFNKGGERGINKICPKIIYLKIDLPEIEQIELNFKNAGKIAASILAGLLGFQQMFIPGYADNSPSVLIIDKDTGKPINSVSVKAEDTDETITTTDNNGTFQISPKFDNAAFITITKDGYQMVVMEKEKLSGTIELKSLPPQLTQKPSPILPTPDLMAEEPSAVQAISVTPASVSPIPTLIVTSPSSNPTIKISSIPSILPSPLPRLSGRASPTPTVISSSSIIKPPIVPPILTTPSPKIAINIVTNKQTTTIVKPSTFPSKSPIPKPVNSPILKGTPTPKQSSINIEPKKVLPQQHQKQRFILNKKLALVTKQVMANTQTNLNISTIQPSSVSENKYIVKAGDCLWIIAEKKLKDPYKWVDIYKLNKNIISDPDLIDVGMVLDLGKV